MKLGSCLSSDQTCSAESAVTPLPSRELLPVLLLEVLPPFQLPSLLRRLPSCRPPLRRHPPPFCPPRLPPRLPPHLPPRLPPRPRRSWPSWPGSRFQPQEQGAPQPSLLLPQTLLRPPC